ncbi:hypothetical protein METHPM2_750005 [Pseudomonas sp. PM2]
MNGVRLLFANPSPWSTGLSGTHVSATEVASSRITAAKGGIRELFNKRPTGLSEAAYTPQSYFSASFKPFTRCDISSPDLKLWRLA